eukprot:TRINITY_DN2256_c0_g1_i3.p1 TRINITY_DN2256_c0_g1~~TRINITY_DN2256_c0_g1_i3.p1  ORF type:complete len:584 (+),score=192.80 TRINITY_DN2256_c0_g1_i3:139-1752(+)
MSVPANKADGLKCINPLCTPLMTDMYQLTMAYAYWQAGRAEEPAVFDLFFRKNPFEGEFTVFGGLGECIALISSFSFSDTDIEYLRGVMTGIDQGFFDWLIKADCSKVKVYAIREGTIVFPRIPLLRIEGPLAVAQLLETPLLNLVNFPSLMATNAARFRLAAGADKKLLEFGLRRAQGPDGGLSASRYAYMGGFDATSNVTAGKFLGLPVSGTHAHAFVQAYSSCEQIRQRCVDGKDVVALAELYRRRLGYKTSNIGELAAFCAYAIAFPAGFLALVDTYDTLQSGIPNFIAVAFALDDAGHRAVGVRLDSGDLAYLSKEVRHMFEVAAVAEARPWLAKVTIVASNDINEKVLHALDEQGHCVDTFGIGTHLVTCQAQPALGCVYKLVEISGSPRMKLSENKNKVTVPGRKCAYRLFGADGTQLLDLMQHADDPPPRAGEPVLCKHPFEATVRAMVTASRVMPLHQLVWDGAGGGVVEPLPTIHEVRAHVMKGMASLREDVKRSLNPTPYKVSLSVRLFAFLHELWEHEAPIKALS